MYNIQFVQGAHNDYLDITEYYDQIKAGGGFAFALALQTTIEILEENPHLYAQQIKHFRRAFLKNFPYVLYYQILEAQKEVEILAIFHNKRSTAYILRRLK